VALVLGVEARDRPGGLHFLKLCNVRHPTFPSGCACPTKPLGMVVMGLCHLNELRHAVQAFLNLPVQKRHLV
jgi:hypothetical protein